MSVPDSAAPARFAPINTPVDELEPLTARIEELERELSNLRAELAELRAELGG